MRTNRCSAWFRRICITLGVLGLALSLAALLFPGRLIAQAKHPYSVPFHLGYRSAPPTLWQHGTLVEFMSRDLSPYYPAHTRFVKLVAALPGDRLVRLGRDFYRNGQYVITARDTDSHGRIPPLFTPALFPFQQSRASLFSPRTCQETRASVVPAGRLFVLGTHERSYDSRYWGFVDADQIIGRVVILL